MIDGYVEYLNKNNIANFNPEEIVRLCFDERSPMKPWHHPELEHGTALLHSEQGMNAYMAAYGDMHILKCRTALQNFPYGELESNPYEIFDWGCGQGIASICLVENLRDRGLMGNLKRVTLVEPSPHTLARAEANVQHMLGSRDLVTAIKAYLPGTKDQPKYNPQYSARIVIHLFSNVLDINGIDLNELASVVARPKHIHYFICIGPLNKGSQRIDDFWRIFGEPECFADRKDKELGLTNNLCKITCKIRCFRYEQEFEPSEVVDMKDIQSSDDYDLNIALQEGYITQTQLKLFKAFEEVLSPQDDINILIQPVIDCPSPDILAIVRGRGVIIVKVFDGNLNEKPEEQKLFDDLHACQNLIIENLSNDKNFTREWSRFGVKTTKMVAYFPNNKQEEVERYKQSISENEHNYITFWGNDKITPKLHDLRDDMKSGFFNEDRYNLLREWLSPRWHYYRDGKGSNMDDAQRKLAESKPGSQQKICSVAGSGKTQVLVTRAVNAQVRTGGNVLILCFTKTLVNYLKQRLDEVKADFPYNRFTIQHVHEFIKEQANVHGISLDKDYIDRPNLFERCSKNIVRYQAIFIDEVEAFKPEWVKTLKENFLSNDGEFVVFGDKKQNIYGHYKLDNDGDMELEVIPGKWDHSLSKPYRFMEPKLVNLAQNYRKQFFSYNTKDLRRETDDNAIFLYAMVDNNTTTINQLSNWCIKCINTYNLDRNETIILSCGNEMLSHIEDEIKQKQPDFNTVTTFSEFKHYRDKQYGYIKGLNDKKRRAFNMQKPGLKMSSTHSFQGWEAKYVILIIPHFTTQKTEYEIDYFPPKEEKVSAVIYTAITRAREKLFIFNLNNPEYDKFFNSQK